MTRVPRATREQVRRRADGRCEYCRRLDRFGITRFHADHIIPVIRHLGSNGIVNLAWACPHCNTNKSSDIASFDERTEDLTLLYNPRTQDWKDHFSLEDGVIIGKTAVGRVTVRLLQMNTADQIEMRRYLVMSGLW